MNSSTAERACASTPDSFSVRSPTSAQLPAYSASKYAELAAELEAKFPSLEEMDLKA